MAQKQVIYWIPGSSHKGPIKSGLSILPSFFLSGRFLWIASLTFSKFSHGARNPYKVVRDRAEFSRKLFFAPKIGKIDPKWTKNRVFLIYWKIFLNFYWIWPIMKIYIPCCVFAQISFLDKLLFLKYGSKCSQPIRLQDFVINHISRRNKWNNLIFRMLVQIHIN